MVRDPNMPQDPVELVVAWEEIERLRKRNQILEERNKTMAENIIKTMREPTDSVLSEREMCAQVAEANRYQGEGNHYARAIAARIGGEIAHEIRSRSLEARRHGK